MKGKEYIRPVPNTWWLQRPSWTRFMLRELTALFVGGYALFLLALVNQARQAAAFATFVAGLRSPLSVILHLIALGMVLYHAVTWFNAAPQAMVLWRGDERVSADLIRGSQYVALLIISILVIWIAVGMGG